MSLSLRPAEAYQQKADQIKSRQQSKNLEYAIGYVNKALIEADAQEMQKPTAEFRLWSYVNFIRDAANLQAVGTILRVACDSIPSALLDAFKTNLQQMYNGIAATASKVSVPAPVATMASAKQLPAQGLFAASHRAAGLAAQTATTSAPGAEPQNTAAPAA